MNRPARLRSLFLVPLACVGVPGTSAQADPPAPTPPSGSDRKVAQNPPDPAKPETRRVRQGQLLETPAQMRYGLPRNPRAEPVDTDLTKPLGLERAVEIGLQRQNSIGIAVAQTDSSSAQLTRARARYFPSVTPSLQYNAQLQPGGAIIIGGQLFGGARQSENLNDGINASLLLWDGGLREAQVGSARRNLFASEYGLGDQRQTVILQVTESYYNLIRSRELVKVQEANVQRAALSLEVIKAQVAAGTAAQSDTLQAEADFANAQVSLLSARNDYNVNQANLKNAMGVVTADTLTLTDEQIAPPETRLDPTPIDDYVRVAYANRLDIKRQQERVNSQGYSVKQAHINNGLNVNAQINQGYQLNPNAGENRTFTVALSYPLFDGFSTRAAVRDSKAQLEIEQRNLDQLQQTTRLNVEQSFLVRELSRQRVVAAQTAVRAAELNYQAALDRQRNGLVNVLDVITAQAQLVNAQVSAVQAIYDFYIADARLRRNIGLNDLRYVPRVPGAKAPLASVPEKMQINLLGKDPAAVTKVTEAPQTPANDTAGRKN